MEDEKLTLIQHLGELRLRVAKSTILLIAVVITVYSFVNEIIPFLVKSVGKVVFIAPQEAFVTNIKVAFFVGLLLSSPFILYQVWSFVSSGLSLKEKKYVKIFAPFSFILFAVGFIFGYFIIMPLGMQFLLGFASDVVSPMITISKYISFIFSLSFAFALVFQLPIVILFLTKIGIVTPATLGRRRREAIVLVFITAAIMTPPDVVTQVLMALPLIFLYELGIIFSRIGYKKHA